MLIGHFELLITSPINLDKLTCEIYYKGEFFALISQETNEFILEIYEPQDTKCWTFALEEFQKILETAKNHLRN
jgi:hypothetical protein